MTNMAKYSIVVILCFTVCAVYVNADIDSGPWMKISDHMICFHARDNKHGTLKFSGPSGMVGALKLVHRKGFVRCANKRVHDSRWGCSNLSFLIRYPLNVIVTDISNHVIYPGKQFLRPTHNHGYWYYLPATDPLHDKELVFTNYETPFYLRHHATLRVWYGEDLVNQWEGDNSGRVCVDVYAHIL